MQNDLISRSALLAIFNHDLKCFETGKKAEKEMYISVADMRKMISEQPTAFNVEKVVEELKEWTFNADVNIGDGTIMNHDLISSENAIDIVERGGTDE